MMMMVVMVMVPEPRWHDDDAPPVAVVMMVVVMVVWKHNELGELDVRLRRRPRFIDRLQRRRGVRNRLKQVRERIRSQHVGRGRNGRGLSGIDGANRRYRAQ